jgi:Zn-dependent protease
MNVLLGTLIALVTTILTWKGVLSMRSEMYDILYFASLTNFVLFFFNLVPAPPLDGGWVAEGLMPYKYKSTFEEYARYGPFVVLAVALISPLNKIFLIPAQFCTEHVYSVFGSLFG